jgi:hypothetical protein
MLGMNAAETVGMHTIASSDLELVTGGELKDINWGKVGKAAVVGGASGLATGGVGGAIAAIPTIPVSGPFGPLVAAGTGALAGAATGAVGGAVTSIASQWVGQ